MTRAHKIVEDYSKAGIIRNNQGLTVQDITVIKSRLMTKLENLKEHLDPKDLEDLLVKVKSLYTSGDIQIIELEEFRDRLLRHLRDSKTELEGVFISFELYEKDLISITDHDKNKAILLFPPVVSITTVQV